MVTHPSTHWARCRVTRLVQSTKPCRHYVLLLLLLPFYDSLSGTTLVSWYQKKHSPTHISLSWSPVILYHLPPSTTIHSILPVQITCLTVFLHNLSPSPLWSTSWTGTFHFILHTFFINRFLLFTTHAYTNATCFAAVRILCHLILVSLNSTWTGIFTLMPPLCNHEQWWSYCVIQHQEVTRPELRVRSSQLLRLRMKMLTSPTQTWLTTSTSPVSQPILQQWRHSLMTPLLIRPPTVRTAVVWYENSQFSRPDTYKCVNFY